MSHSTRDFLINSGFSPKAVSEFLEAVELEQIADYRQRPKDECKKGDPGCEMVFGSWQLTGSAAGNKQNKTPTPSQPSGQKVQGNVTSTNKAQGTVTSGTPQNKQQPKPIATATGDKNNPDKSTGAKGGKADATAKGQNPTSQKQAKTKELVANDPTQKKLREAAEKAGAKVGENKKPVEVGGKKFGWAKLNGVDVMVPWGSVKGDGKNAPTKQTGLESIQQKVNEKPQAAEKKGDEKAPQRIA